MIGISRRGFSLLSGLTLLACALLPAAGWGQWIKLSNSPFSDVTEFEISPDGGRVVYLQDTLSPGVFQLWSVPMNGGSPVRLSGLAQPNVSSPRISPDGLHVVYISRDTSAFQIYRVPIEGGQNPLQLSVTAPVGTFRFSPDSERVVFAERAGGVVELYSVPITGGLTPVKLNGTLVSGGDVERNDFLVSPDGSRVVYLADQQTDEVFELYSAPITGGGAIKLNGALVAGGDVRGFFKISPDGSRVVYQADQDTNDVLELYSVPITGGGTTRLNGDLVSGGVVLQFLISPDGGRVVYRADQDIDDVAELYSVPIDGGGAVKLSGMLVAGDNVRDFSITPDGSRVLYTAGAFNLEALYSVPTAGGAAPIKLSRALIPASQVFSFSISPDSNWVVYDQDFDPIRRRGHHASTFGPTESGELLWGTALLNPIGYLIDPGSRYVVVSATRLGDADPIRRLWQAPLTGGPNLSARELIPAADFVAGGDVDTGGGFQIGPKGSLVYRADQETDGVIELYAIPGVLFSDGFE